MLHLISWSSWCLKESVRQEHQFACVLVPVRTYNANPCTQKARILLVRSDIGQWCWHVPSFALWYLHVSPVCEHMSPGMDCLKRVRGVAPLLVNFLLLFTITYHSLYTKRSLQLFYRVDNTYSPLKRTKFTIKVIYTIKERRWSSRESCCNRSFCLEGIQLLKYPLGLFLNCFMAGVSKLRPAVQFLLDHIRFWKHSCIHIYAICVCILLKCFAEIVSSSNKLKATHCCSYWGQCHRYHVDCLKIHTFSCQYAKIGLWPYPYLFLYIWPRLKKTLDTPVLGCVRF